MNYYGIDTLIDCSYNFFQDAAPNGNKMSQKKYRLSIIEYAKQKYAMASDLPSGSKKRLRGNYDIDEAYPDRNKNVGDHVPIFSEKKR